MGWRGYIRGFFSCYKADFGEHNLGVQQRGFPPLNPGRLSGSGNLFPSNMTEEGKQSDGFFSGLDARNKEGW